MAAMGATDVTDVVMATRVIAFETLPVEIVIHIVKRMTLLTFIMFCRTNKYLYENRANFANFLSTETIAFHYKAFYLIIANKLGSEILQKLFEHIKKTDRYGDDIDKLSMLCDISRFGARYNNIDALLLSCNTSHTYIAIKHNQREAFQYIVEKCDSAKLEIAKKIVQECAIYCKSRAIMQYFLEELNTCQELVDNFRENGTLEIVLTARAHVDVLDYIVDKFEVTFEEFVKLYCRTNNCITDLTYDPNGTIILQFLFEKYDLDRSYCDMIYRHIFGYNTLSDAHVMLSYLVQKFNITKVEIEKSMESMSPDNKGSDMVKFLVMDVGVDITYCMDRLHAGWSSVFIRPKHFIVDIMQTDSEDLLDFIYDSGYVVPSFKVVENQLLLSKAMKKNKWNRVRYLANKLQITIDDVFEYNKSLDMYDNNKIQVHLFSICINKEFTAKENNDHLWKLIRMG